MLQNKISDFKTTEKQLAILKSQVDTLQSKIDIASSVANYHDSCNYQKKIDDLKQSIDQSRSKAQDIERFLSE